MNRFVLPDTNFLIAVYNEAGDWFERYSTIVQRHIIRYSSVVLNEFLRGAHDTRSQKIVRELTQLAAGKIVVPSERHWLQCGKISQKILKGKKMSREEVGLLQNDILIALSVREIGGTLLTRDRSDFELIGRYISFDLEFFP